MAAGPWGDDDQSGGDSSSSGGRGKKGSPWLPGGGNSDGSGKGPARPGFDEILRRGPFGPNMPQIPGGRKAWLWGALGVVGLLLVTTSVHILEPQEDGVITRLGSYSRTVGPGINLTLPFPFETLIKVPSRTVRTEDIPSGQAQNLVLTGDANIINLAYTVRWKVGRPDLYVFQVEGPEETIRAAAESAMRATVANFTLAQTIGTGRTDIELQVQRRLQTILNRYQMGVLIDGVSIRESAPPADVQAAFDSVNVAQQDAESFLNEARAYASSVTSSAEGAAAEFDRIYEQYRQAPEVTRRRIYYETMEQVLTPSEKTIINSNSVVPYLPLPGVQRRTPPTAAQPATEATRP